MITNGTVTIEDGKKAAEEYAPARKVSVSITFAVPEGVTESAQSKIYLDTAGDIANAKVNELLGRGAARRATVSAEVTVEASKITPAPEAPKETAAAKKARLAAEKAAGEPGKTKDDLAKEAGLPTTDTVHKAPAEAQEGLAEEPAPATPVGIADELESLGIDAAPAITDKELGDAANKKAIELRAKHGDKYDPTILRALLTSYYGTGTRIASIPTDKRPEFMEKLAALK